MSPSVEVNGRWLGIAPATATEQLQRSFPPDVPVQPLPDGNPGRTKAFDLGVRRARR
jgi:hypothetical protein